ncbi:MAG TPA: MarR family transcriptional regulator [Mycobacteriales bacterium]|nr:MarR family transcriptional regulator [Mycobacteriales bacterium]
MSRRTAPAPAPTSAQATELFAALITVVKRLRRHPLPVTAELSAAVQGTTPAPRHVAALVHIATEGTVGMSELAERLSVSLATLSPVVSELVDWGLVDRTTDPHDRRRTFLTLAPEHEPTIHALLDSRLRPVERALQRLEPPERAAFIRGLDVLADELDQMKENDR